MRTYSVYILKIKYVIQFIKNKMLNKMKLNKNKKNQKTIIINNLLSELIILENQIQLKKKA